MAECAEKEANTSDNADSVGGKVIGESEDRVKLCGPCFEEETEVPATKFCIDCQDHLCDTCVQYHRKVKLTKTHELIDTGAGEHGFRKSEGHLDVFNCTIHQKVITHYCEKHAKLCCAKCIDGAHSICAEFIYNVKGTDTSINEKPEFKEFVEKMHKLTIVFNEIKQRTATNIEKGMENFVKDIETLREAKDEEVARIQTIESSCDSVLGDLKRWKDMVENGNLANDYEKLFLVMKLASEQLQFFGEHVQVLKDNNRWMFNSLTLQSLQCGPKERRMPIFLKKMTLNGNADDISVRDICPIGQKIAVTDGAGKKIHLVDLNSTNVKSEMKLNSYPWEVTGNSSGELFLCFQGQPQIIKFLQPHKDINDWIEIKTDPNRYCCRCFQDVVKLVGRDPFSLQEVNASGYTIVRHDESCFTGISSLPAGTHSAIDEESGSIFLIGKEPFGLKEITNNGEIEAVSLTTSIASPGGIVLDTDGTFLVSSESEKSIKRVSLEGSVEDYITGLEFVPHGLGMDRVRRLLYVGGLKSNVILM